MIKVFKYIHIPDKTPSEVYGLLRQIESYPSFIPHIKKLSVINKSTQDLVSNWEVQVDDITIQWKERDNFDDNNRKILFEMVEGDYKSYSGSWSVENDDSGSKITIIANFDWGIPVLEQHVTKTLERKAKTALFGMLKAFKKRLEIAT